MVALVSDCRLVVCGDTGVGPCGDRHGTPSVLLFGPTPPSRWGPRGAGPHLALWAGTSAIRTPTDRTPGYCC